MSLLFFALFCNDLKSIFSWIDFDFIWTFGRNLQIFKISGFLSVLDAFQVYGQPVSCGCPTLSYLTFFGDKFSKSELFYVMQALLGNSWFTLKVHQG